MLSLSHNGLLVLKSRCDCIEIRTNFWLGSHDYFVVGLAHTSDLLNNFGEINVKYKMFNQIRRKIYERYYSNVEVINAVKIPSKGHIKDEKVKVEQVKKSATLCYRKVSKKGEHVNKCLVAIKGAYIDSK